MKINGNIMHSAQKYLDLVTGNCYMVDDMEQVKTILKKNGYNLVSLDPSGSNVSSEIKLSPIFYVSLENMGELFKNKDCESRNFVLVEALKNADSETQECFLCEVPEQQEEQ